MRRQRNMIAAALLLCAVGVYCSDSRAAQSQDCVPTDEVACFLPVNYMDATGPVRVEVRVGKKLNISLEGLYEYSDCQWIRGKDAVTAMNFSDSIILPSLSGTDSGEYTLSCEVGNGTRSSLSVALHVAMTRPTKPQLILTNTENPKQSPSFKCKSTGSPKPTLQWSGKVHGTNLGGNIETAESTIKTLNYINSGVMCCATNPEGQECSQLYTYDPESNTMEKEVSSVTLSPGQSLLLLCRQPREPFKHRLLMWEKGNTNIVPKTLGCPSKNKEEICIKKDTHSGSQMAYLLIESVSVNQTGIYTCRNQVNKTKSVNIHVQAEDFLSVKLDDRRIVKQEESTPCLKANVSYHPMLQRCTWEDPDKIKTKCIRNEWVTMHRTVKLCNRLKSGEYKLHLEAGGQKETKTVSVCVIDKPKFNFNKVHNGFTVETWSHVPANYSWMSCSTNVSCETDFAWEEIPGTTQTDSEVSCNKTIKSSVSRYKVDGKQFKFCVTTSVGSECKAYPPYGWPEPQQSVGRSDPENGNSTLLRIGSSFLLLALIVVSVVLTYFVKKKKPQYQPQLQMLQMVGPNDNDYIYINFKDFEYDSKWEFPRENLELGKELGSGAFGMVLQATAYGINKPGVSQQVAVKMLKDKHQTVEKEALMSELKMLTHIGHHANIVNLLGACTDTGPIYLIFQYCRHGDLLNYLKNNSKRYHKSVTDAFNKDRFRSLYHNLHPRKTSSEKQTTVDNYVPMYGSTTRGQEDITLLTINSCDMDSFEDPEMFENLDDQTEDLEALTFDDLLSFAYQVAKGMDFLCGKNCIHRDLAARNVLVTKGRMVKIGDFGLARDIDNDSNYVVRGNVRLPVKWMAPESIFQGMYTMKSDVWAYGILLWEIFSLGVTPYPDMKVDHVFYSMIEKGFKMECPYYANQSVYEIMCKCWALDACQRPSFSKMVSFMSSLLTDREEKLYHNMLNDYSCDYQNAPVILDISALTKQNENKTQSVNDYCKAHTTEESKAEMCDSDTVEAEEKLLKTSGTE
ncbi:receptor-type tyrosine-protein kinase FLT3 [Scomber scombrus]|uniref:receptor-type tyrosine-protein kinase FLT3 n=1 Tax=Scomber scombrus TaxID=13677 RepID=UPI002DDA81FE|nr:receptor-type tyrosine-protein kinase FLT3 [Scomber scombrus]